MTHYSSCARRMLIFITAALIGTVLATTIHADGGTPWEFFRANIDKADSVSSRLGIVFITIVLIWLSLGVLRLLLPIGLIALAALIVRKPHVRRSRLVQIGFAVLLLGLVPLVLAGILGADNAVGLGLLFAFLAPIGLLSITVGTIVALFRQAKD